MILEDLRDKVYELADTTLSGDKTSEHVEKAMHIVALYTEVENKSDSILKISVEQQGKLQDKLHNKIGEALESAKESMTYESLDKVIILMKSLRYII